MDPGAFSFEETGPSSAADPPAFADSRAWKGSKMCAKGVLWEREWGEASPAILRDVPAFMAALQTHVGWDIDGDAARAIFTELITNSIKHGKRPISARLECDRTDVKLLVEDHGHGFERSIGAPAPLSLGGRGLLIVSSYARHLEIGGNPRGTKIVATLPRK